MNPVQKKKELDWGCNNYTQKRGWYSKRGRFEPSVRECHHYRTSLEFNCMDKTSVAVIPPETQTFKQNCVSPYLTCNYNHCTRTYSEPIFPVNGNPFVFGQKPSFNNIWNCSHTSATFAPTPFNPNEYASSPLPVSSNEVASVLAKEEEKPIFIDTRLIENENAQF